MKLLLIAINAKYIHSNLAVYSLRSYAKKYTDHISLLEYTINHKSEDILKAVYQEQADVVAFSCYIWNIEIVTTLVCELRKLMPKVKFWFGGPEVSYDIDRRFAINPALDGIMIGEGEQTFLELAEYYIDGTRKLEDIAGLAYKETARMDCNQSRNHNQSMNHATEQINPTILTTKVRQPLSLDAIPFPYETITNFENRIIYYESSRGCPFTCSYCLSSIDKKVRLRSTKLVKEELAFFLEQKVAQVKFVDRTFNCSRSHAMDIWQFLKENDNGITNFHFEISADLLSEEELKLLSELRPGQVQLEIGVQSTNETTVEAIHRKMDFAKLSKNVTAIKAGHNIHQHLDLIAGLPLEGYSAFEKSFQEVYALKPDQLQLGFLKVLKGSRMETDTHRYGIVYRDTPPYEVLCTNSLSYEELLKIKGVCEMVEVYYNSGQFTNAITFLEHYYPSYMMLYQALSDFYEKKNQDIIAHSRIRRYEILLDFYIQMLLSSKPKNEQEELTNLFKEILLYDLLLREDLKSRPAFAKAPSEVKKLKECYERYKKEQKQIHLESFSYDVIASAKEGLAIHKKQILMFDYSKKDPLNKSAEVNIVT